MSEKSMLLEEMQRMFGSEITPIQKAKIEQILNQTSGNSNLPYENHSNPSQAASLQQAIYRLVQELKYFQVSRPKEYEKLRSHALYIMSQVHQLSRQGNLEMAHILLAGLLTQLKTGRLLPKDVFNPTEI